MQKKIIQKTLSIIAISFSVFGTIFVYASFVEHLSAPATSNQDFAENVLGANSANNEFDSAGVLPNNDGSILERVKYLASMGKIDENDTIFFVGGSTYFCKKRVISSAGEVTISNINQGELCDTGKHCNAGACE